MNGSRATPQRLDTKARHGEGSWCLCFDGTRPLGCLCIGDKTRCLARLAVAEPVMLKRTTDGFLAGNEQTCWLML